MSIPSIYINLEDDVSKIVERLKRASSQRVVLVCPKRCFLFSDSINLRLLKKQTDLLKKEVFILTMDEKGQIFAKEAGFQLKFLPKSPATRGFSDIKPKTPPVFATQEEEEPDETEAREEQEEKFQPQKQASAKIAPVIKTETAPLTESQINEVVEELELPAPEASAQAAEALEPVPAISAIDNYFPKEIETVHQDIKEKRRTGKIIAGFVAVCLLIFLLLVFVILPKADVTVYAQKQPIARDLEINLTASATSTNESAAILPAQKLDQTVQTQDTFQSQGKNEVGNPASGEVTIYNFTKVPITLKAATTILTAGGQTYKLDEDVINLRPTAYSNNQTKEINPDTLGQPVQITASQGGDSYNLPSGTRLEISNQVFGSRPQVLWAKTQTAITGGTSRYISVVTPADASSSESQLLTEAIQKLRGQLSSQGLVMPDQAFAVKVNSFSMSQAVGAEAPSFQATLSAEVTGLDFSGSQLQQLVVGRISETLPNNTTLQVTEFSPASSSVDSIDLGAGNASISAHFEGDAVANIDLGDIKSQLAGKSQSQAVDLLMSNGGIDKIDITLVPSWQKNFPWFQHSIAIKVID